MSATKRSPGWNVVWWLSTRVGLPLILLTLILWATVDSAARRVLGPLSWYADVSYQSVFWRFNGEVGIDGLRIAPYGAEDESETIHAEHVTVHTPGFLWLLKAAFHDAEFKPRGKLGRLQRALEGDEAEKEPEAFPPANRMAVTIDNLTFGGENWAFGDLDWLGFASAAPYEAEGCGDDVEWVEAELRQMGVPANPVRMTFGYEVLTDSMVTVNARLAREGSSSAEYMERFKAENAADFFNIDWDKATTYERRWTIKDDGFVARRNTFCAKREGISRPEFVERHVAAIERLLLADGAVAPPALLAAYRRYASRGAEVVWESKPMTTIPMEQFHHYAKADQIRMLNASLKVKGMEPVPFELTFVEPVPLPEEPGEKTLEEQLEAELRAERGQQLGVDATSAAATAATAPAGAAPAETQPTAASTADAQPAASKPADAQSAASKPADTTPAGATPSDATAAATQAAGTAAAASPPADAKPARVFADATLGTRSTASTKPAVTVASVTTSVAASGTELAYEDVAKYVGRVVTVDTVYRTRRTGVVEKHNNGAITLKVDDRGGSMLLTLPRPTIQRIVAGTGRRQ